MHESALAAERKITDAGSSIEIAWLA